MPPCAQTFLGYGDELDCVVTKGLTKIIKAVTVFLQLGSRNGFYSLAGIKVALALDTSPMNTMPLSNETLGSNTGTIKHNFDL